MQGEHGFKDNPNVSPGSPLLGPLKILAGAAILLGALYLFIGVAVDVAVPRLSDNTVRWLVSRVDWVRLPSAMRDQTSERAVQHLADRLEAANPGLPHVRVLVVRKPTVNALAFPDGTVLVFTGLLERMHSENELAFVLGHEMAHVANRDSLRGLGRTLVFGWIAQAMGFGSEHVFESPATMSELAFSRGQEERADRDGMDSVYNLYGHVGGYDEFFKALKAEKDESLWTAYFASHPLAAHRIELLTKHARDKGYTTGKTLPLFLPRQEDTSL